MRASVKSENSKAVALIQKRGVLKTVAWPSDMQFSVHSNKSTKPMVSVSAELEETTGFSLLDYLGLQPVGRRQQFHFGSVSTTLRCTMWLSVMLLGAYTVLACLRNAIELTEGSKVPRAVEILEMVIRSASMAGALCALFVACRMYVLASTAGKGEPPSWVRLCMTLATFGLTLQVFLCFFLPSMLMEREKQSITALAGDPVSSHPLLYYLQGTRAPQDDFEPQGDGIWFFACFLQGFAALSIYGGAAGVIAGIFAFDNPMLVSPAIISVIVLITFFLLSQACLAVLSMLSRSKPGAGISAVAQRGMKIPMIAVFFLAVRMRNLQIDPPDGVPPQWVWISFLVILIGMLCELIVSGFCPGSAHKQLTLDGLADADIVDDAKTVATGYSPHNWVRYCQQIFALIVFGGLGAVAVSVVISTGKDHALSSTMKCVMVLSALHFGVQVLQWGASFTDGGVQAQKEKSTALSAGVCVNITPLLSILFVACRMRSLQLTNQTGNPHWWAQDSMKVSVGAVLLQVMCCILLPIFTGAATSVDSDGNSEYNLKPLFGAYVVQCVKYVALLCLYGGILSVCASIVLMYEGMPDLSHPETGGIRLATQIAWCLFVLAVAGILSSAKVVGFVVKWTIEGLDETLLGVNIWVGKAALSLCRGYIFVGNLVVDNPEGTTFASPALLKVGKIVVKLNIWRALKTGGKEIEIMTLVLSGLQVNYEKDSFTNSNVHRVVEFVSGNEVAPVDATSQDKAAAVPLPRQKTAVQATPNEGEELGLNVELHLLQITDIAANVWLHGTELVSVNLGDIEEKDFQEHYGAKSVPVELIVQEILKTILNTVVHNSHRLSSNVVGIAQETAMSGVRGAEEGFRKLLSCLPCGPASSSSGRRRKPGTEQAPPTTAIAG